MFDPQPNSALLLTLPGRTTYVRHPGIQILGQRLQSVSIPHHSYLSHSFWKEAAQHTVDNGMLEKHIQNLS